MNDRCTHSARPGFTLVEMAIVLGLVVLVATMALPTMMKLIDTNASAQAFNIMAAHLRAARATAIANDGYGGLHHQKVDHTSPGNENLRDHFFMAVLYQSEEETLTQRVLHADDASTQFFGDWFVSPATDITGAGQYDNLGVNNSANYVIYNVEGLPHLDGIVAYKVYMRWGGPASGENIRVEVQHYGGTTPVTVHQTGASRKWVLLGEFPFGKGSYDLTVNTEGASGTVVMGSFLLATSLGLNSFGAAAGQAIKDLPGSMAFGELKKPQSGDPTFEPDSNTFGPGVYDGGSYSPENAHGDFTSFTVVFDARGSLASLPNGDNVALSPAMISPPTAEITDEDNWLWDRDVANGTSGNGEPGARMLGMFNYAKFRAARGGGIDYLNRNARIMAINVHTGELLTHE